MNIIDKNIIKLLSQKTGKDVTTPMGASMLRNAIEAETGQHLGLSTVKRLLGVIPYNYTPRVDTLEIISKFLGFESWQLLQDFINDKISHFGEDDLFIDLVLLPANALIDVVWEPNRKILLRHIGGNEFIVENAENSKLQSGDILTLSSLAKGFPFMAKAVIRNQENLGPYTAAKELGIKNLVVHNPP